MTKDEIDSRLDAIRSLTADWDKLSDSDRRRNHERVGQHQAAIRQAFGASRAWRQVDEPFPLRALASGADVGGVWEPEFTDHHSFWISGGVPVAVVGHLYSCDEKRRAEAEAWAACLGLRATFPTDFPSWWNPGRTTLIEITRG